MVKPGYKQTEIGIIPEDWTVANFGSKVKIFRGGSPRPIQDYLTQADDGVNWIKIGDVREGDKYITSTEEKIIHEGVSRSRTVHAGDFILSNSMSFGRPYILNIDGCIHDGWLTIQEYEQTFSKDFLYYLLSSDSVYQQYISMAAGSSVKNLNKEKVSALVVAYPEIGEQEKIAGALSCIDALIAYSEKELAKEKAIKQGAMQELLTGKKRLPGFSGEWKSYKLRDLGEFLKGSGISRAESNTGKIPAVRYGELYTHHYNYVVDYISRISKAVAAKAKQVYKGDILFAASGETKEEIGKCAAIFSQETIYAGGDILIFRPSVYLNPIFMGTLLNTADVCRQRAEKGQGDAVVHIHTDSLGSIKIRIPENSEQDAIADILFEMDKEIKLLEQKLEKYRQVKRGMMQQLLTGKIRLV